MNNQWIQALQKDLAGRYDPITGQWLGGSGSVQDDAGQWYGLLNSSGANVNPYGDQSGMYTQGSGKPLDPYNIMDAQGQDTGQDGQYSPPDDSSMMALKYMAALAAVGFGGSMLAGAGGGGGAGGALAGDAFMPGALGAGGSEVGFGSVIPGLESFALPAGGMPGYNFMGGDATMPGALGANGANMSTAALPGLESYVTGGAGLAGAGAKAAGAGSGLLGKALGAGATLLGGAAGAQGNQNEQSTTRDLPDYLKTPLLSLLSDSDALRKQQMAPGYMAGYDQMRATGQNLLSQPIAGNGFSKFFGGK